MANPTLVTGCRIVMAERCILGITDYDTAPSFGYCAAQDCYCDGYKFHALWGISRVIHSADMSKAYMIYTIWRTSDTSTITAQSSATKDIWAHPYNWICPKHPRSDWKCRIVWIKRIGNQLSLRLQKQGNVGKRFPHSWLTNLWCIAIMLNNK